MVRPFPWPLKRIYLMIIADIDNPASAHAVAELYRQAQSSIPQGTLWSRIMCAEAAKTLAGWPNRKTAILFSQMLDSIKNGPKSDLENSIGYLLGRSSQWKEVLSKLKNEPDMKEHYSRLISALEIYQKRIEKSRSASKPKYLIPAIPFRKWSDATGKFLVEARLDYIGRVKVWLKKPDGKFISMPISQLSKADQEYVEKTHSKLYPGRPVSKKPAPK